MPDSIQTLPLTGRHIYLVLVSSMEQVIGAAQSTIIGIIIPLLNLIVHPEFSATEQGLMGAMGLIGIAIGSILIGPLADKHGYLGWFRICPTLIIAGAFLSALLPDGWTICLGMFIAGIGVGGGYPLDSAYISELMPLRWKSFMVGVAKASCAVGFTLPAAISVFALKDDSSPEIWRWIVWIMGVLGIITLLLRIRWAQSPGWLLARGRTDEAKKAADFFFGKTISRSIAWSEMSSKSVPPKSAKLTHSRTSLFSGKTLLRIIYSGIPWACEGLGVYGIGVFLPVLIMALGLEHTTAAGISKIIDSVGLTTIINLCILPGFVIGLIIVNRLNHPFMLWAGFGGSAISLGVLLIAYILHWPIWVSLAAFMIFEITLNAGPHLITYIIPAEIFPVQIKGTGAGLAGFFGKVGAILGVFFIPIILRSGGMELVLIVCIAVMLLGGTVTLVCSHILGLKPFCIRSKQA